MDCPGSLADTMIENMYKGLLNNGWLSESEIQSFLANKDLNTAIKYSTSPIFENIFNALNYVSYDRAKVLILGQDPYPNPLHAHGLAFSSKNSTTPGSLRNIFKAIDSVYGSNLVSNKKNDLTPWAESGVVLLNTALTYKNTYNQELSTSENKKLQIREKSFHMSVWKNFIDIIITKLLNRNKKLVMLLWGGEAWNIVLKNIERNEIKYKEAEKGKILIPDKEILILHTDHPSQVKINLGGKFLEQAPLHFIECDKFLGADKINWINL